MEGDVQRFFYEYGQALGGKDEQDIAAFHDDHVLHATPKTASGFRNDARYRAWLRRTLQRNREAGLVAIAPTGIGSYDLGPTMAIATVQWRTQFTRAERPIDTTVTYLLRRAPDGLRILCAAAHEDPEETLRLGGIVPTGRPSRSAKRVRTVPTPRKKAPKASGADAPRTG